MSLVSRSVLTLFATSPVISGSFVKISGEVTFCRTARMKRCWRRMRPMSPSISR